MTDLITIEPTAVPLSSRDAAETGRASGAAPFIPLSDFDRDRLKAHMWAESAARRPGISALKRAQMLAASKLAGIDFHEIKVEADDRDAAAVIDDLIALWRIIDPLVEAFGDEAKANFGISEDEVAEFKDALKRSLDGNATAVLDQWRDEFLEENRVEDE